jgi:hypothetical protein
MRYQLVLQWTAESSTMGYEKLLETEELLTKELPRGCEVDGHDAGSGEMNIFILIGDPLLCFQRVQQIIGKRETWANIRVAYRESSGSKYTILWPAYLTEFGVA